ncbi:TadE family type IV pilus minor pilin [Microbispora sp. NPDC049125]|uniref:TadE family type IV pilus minor pilin n=1 Tax=Microbispora sp. NPDC049125 TaxID=3154929 RepID=UPI003467E321
MLDAAVETAGTVRAAVRDACRCSRPASPSAGGLVVGGVPARRERGSVTAEAAVGLPALVVVLAAALWAVTVVGAHLRCVDAARAGARAAARGEAVEAVIAAVRQAAPAKARVDVSLRAQTARVEVSVAVGSPAGSLLPSVPVRASAVAATEPGVLLSGQPPSGQAAPGDPLAQAAPPPSGRGAALTQTKNGDGGDGRRREPAGPTESRSANGK